MKFLEGGLIFISGLKSTGLSKMIRYNRMNCRKGKEVFLSKNQKFLIILGFLREVLLVLLRNSMSSTDFTLLCASSDGLMTRGAIIEGELTSILSTPPILTPSHANRWPTAGGGGRGGGQVRLMGETEAVHMTARGRVHD